MLFSEDAAFGEIYSANLTSGENGIARRYSDDEIARAIWYGVKQDGAPTVGMPYEFFQGIHVGDMENLIAYLRSAPPIDTDYPAASYGPMLRVMHAANLFPLVAAEKIDGEPAAARHCLAGRYAGLWRLSGGILHRLSRPRFCRDCHRGNAFAVAGRYYLDRNRV
jgi:hypothetical protein